MTCFKICVLVLSVTAGVFGDGESFAEANNKFAPAVYKQLATTKSGNIIVSPLSAELVLTLLQFGCKGATAKELRTALHLPNNDTEIKREVKSLFPESKCNNSLILELANKIYVQQNFTINQSFEKVAVEVFDAKSETINFAKSKEAAQTINKWVEKHTNNTIKDLVSPDALSAATVVVLVNALHFKGDWLLPFSTTTTRKADFFKNSSDVILVDTLYQDQKSFDYYESKELKAQLLKLDFKGGASMIFVLPTETEGLARVEAKLDTIFTSSFAFKSTPLTVALPKFKFDTTIDFKQILKKLNVTKIFNANEADLSGIAGHKGDLYVSQVIQKAFIDLNEGGVEASAATYVAITKLATPINRKSFIANHPFIFFIKYENVILFAGRVTEPKY